MIIQQEKSKKFVFKKWWRTGQAIAEYAILIAVVSAAFMVMGVYVRRAIQGKLYRIEDRITSKTVGKPAPAPPFIL